MKKHKLIAWLLSSLIFASVPPMNPINDATILSQAHGGRTDSSGGHKDNKNKSGLGYYHYHCGGHPAHLHTDGICPYADNSTATAAITTKTETNSSNAIVTDPISATPTEEQPAITNETNEPTNVGWRKDSAERWMYYYTDSSYVKNKWELIDGKYYCFNEYGHLYINTVTPDGYTVNENGEWVE